MSDAAQDRIENIIREHVFADRRTMDDGSLRGVSQAAVLILAALRSATPDDREADRVRAAEEMRERAARTCEAVMSLSLKVAHEAGEVGLAFAETRGFGGASGAEACAAAIRALPTDNPARLSRRDGNEGASVGEITDAQREVLLFTRTYGPGVDFGGAKANARLRNAARELEATGEITNYRSAGLTTAGRDALAAMGPRTPAPLGATRDGGGDA